MKTTPEKYANDFINQYNAVGLQLRNEAVQCAIIDVSNTIESVSDTLHWSSYCFEVRFYKKVIKILESKL